MSCLDHLCSDRPLGHCQTSSWEAGETPQTLGLHCCPAEPRVSSGTGALRDVLPGTAQATTSSPGECG